LARVAPAGTLLAGAAFRGCDPQGRRLWSYEKAVPVVSSPLLHDGLVYTVKDGGILTALDAETGRVVKQARLGAAVDTYYASPIAAAGRIYILGEGGTLSVVEAGRDWTLLWSGELGEPGYATPAVAGDTLYVRTAAHLYAFGPAEGPVEPLTR